MKKTLAIILIVLFTLMIMGRSNQVGKTPHLQQGDVAGFIGEIVGYVLLYVGLYYSTKWLMKLSGHTYKVGRQTWAALLFWYSILAIFIGLMMPVYERNLSGLIFGGVMVVIWSLSAYACRRWQQRLRTAERAQVTVPQSQPA
jgi:hypothetical protein